MRSMREVANLDAVNRRVDTTNMGFIPAGPVMMGSDEGGDFEKPVHEVQLDGFWMDTTPVTNCEFGAFVNATGYQTEAEKSGSAWGYDGERFRQVAGLCWRDYAVGRDDHPIVLVSWYDAVAFASWLGKRLPTEAEWEKSARGNRMRTLFPWGNQQPNGTQSNFAAAPSPIPPTTPVRQFSANSFGLYDMVGNVWQWCADWYSDDTYSSSLTTNPQGPNVGTHRVRRGGSWNVIQAFRLRCANRGAFEPSQFAVNIGFRCVADLS